MCALLAWFYVDFYVDVWMNEHTDTRARAHICLLYESLS